MKTIELVDSKGRKHILGFSQAEAMLQLGNNCMLKVSVPKESDYYFDGVLKRKKSVKRQVNSKK